MSDEVKEAIQPPVQPAQPAQTPKPKSPKPEKVKLRLTRAGSCNYEGIILKKNETVELEASQAEQLMKSGLFERL